MTYQQFGPPAPEPARRSHTARNILLTVGGVIVILIVIAAATSKKTPTATVASQSTTTSAGAGSTTAGAASTTKPAGAASKPAAAKPTGAAADLTITKCAADDNGQIDAKVKVTNNSAKASNYIGSVIFESKDGKTQLDTSPIVVDELAPGQSTTQDAVTMTDAPKAGFTCRIGDVTRYAS